MYCIYCGVHVRPGSWQCHASATLRLTTSRRPPVRAVEKIRPFSKEEEQGDRNARVTPADDIVKSVLNCGAYEPACQTLPDEARSLILADAVAKRWLSSTLALRSTLTLDTWFGSTSSDNGGCVGETSFDNVNKNSAMVQCGTVYSNFAVHAEGNVAVVCSFRGHSQPRSRSDPTRSSAILAASASTNATCIHFIARNPRTCGAYAERMAASASLRS